MVSDQDLLSAVRRVVEESWTYEGQIWRDRETALHYYYMRPLGNEEEGKSSVITSDVFDIVEAEIPGLMEVFASSKDCIQINPLPNADPQAFAKAKQQAAEAKTIIDRILWKQNNWFLILHTWIKDALLTKNGVVTWYPEAITVVKEDVLQGAAIEQLVMLQQQGAEIVEHSANIDGTHDVRFRVKQKKVKICIENVPAPEFIPDQNARSPRPADMTYCAQVYPVTLSDLRMYGYQIEDDISDDIPYQRDHLWNALRQDQSYDERIRHEANADPSTRIVWLRNVFILIDRDEDGIAELRNIKYVGDRLLEDRVVDHIAFACFTPIPLPHQYYGLATADLGIPLQDLSSTLWRQAMNAMYLANEPRLTVRRGSGVSLDELLSVRPNQVVRVGTQDDIKPMYIPVAQTTEQAYRGIEFVRSVTEARVGVKKYHQGIDSDALTQKTAKEVGLTYTAAMQRQKLRARILGEIGLKDLIRGVLLTVKNYGKSMDMSAEVNGMQYTVDPSQWPEEFDIEINTGAAFDKDAQMMVWRELAQNQSTAIQMGGLNQIVTLANVYNAQTRFLEVAGIKNVTDYWTNPASQPPPQPQPNPEIEAAKQKAELEMQKEQMRSQTEIRKAEIMAQTELQKENIESATKLRQVELELAAGINPYGR